MQLFAVRRGSGYESTIETVIVTATSRDYAAAKATSYLGGNPDQYVITPITKPGERIHFDISMIAL